SFDATRLIVKETGGITKSIDATRLIVKETGGITEIFDATQTSRQNGDIYPPPTFAHTSIPVNIRGSLFTSYSYSSDLYKSFYLHPNKRVSIRNHIDKTRSYNDISVSILLSLNDYVGGGYVNEGVEVRYISFLYGNDLDIL